MLTPGDLGGLPSHIPTLPSLLGERNYSSLLLGKSMIVKLMAMANGSLGLKQRGTFGDFVICNQFTKSNQITVYPNNEIASAGKWHLGVGAEGESLPTRRGFQQYLGVILMSLMIMRYRLHL